VRQAGVRAGWRNVPRVMEDVPRFYLCWPGRDAVISPSDTRRLYSARLPEGPVRRPVDG